MIRTIVVLLLGLTTLSLFGIQHQQVPQARPIPDHLVFRYECFLKKISALPQGQDEATLQEAHNLIELISTYDSNAEIKEIQQIILQDTHKIHKEITGENEKRIKKTWKEKALAIAVTADSLDGIEALFNGTTPPDINTLSFPKKQTPLLCAAKHSDIAMIKLLLSKGANSNLQDKYGDTPLTIAASRGYDYDPEIVQLLLPLAERSEKYSVHVKLNSLLHRAIRENNFNQVKQLLQLKIRPDVNSIIHGMTQLMSAAYCCDHRIFELLLYHNAYLTVENENAILEQLNISQVNKTVTKRRMIEGIMKLYHSDVAEFPRYRVSALQLTQQQTQACNDVMTIISDYLQSSPHEMKGIREASYSSALQQARSLVKRILEQKIGHEQLVLALWRAVFHNEVAHVRELLQQGADFSKPFALVGSPVQVSAWKLAFQASTGDGSERNEIQKLIRQAKEERDARQKTYARYVKKPIRQLRTIWYALIQSIINFFNAY